MIKSSTHSIKGMQRDLAVSKFNPEFAFDAHNIRITAMDNNTLLSITNEKGNEQVAMIGEDGQNILIQGTVLGYNTVGKYLIVFSTDNSTDYIYRLEKKDNYFEIVILYQGYLDFSITNPIESISSYESSQIQKVYWVDGRNVTRYINVTKGKYSRIGNKIDTQFDFNRNLKLNEEVSIKKINGGGLFASGVIQYALSYYDLYGAESAIFYVSQLQYIGYDNRGASPEDKVNKSFEITIKNLDSSFDYIRIYSIHRSSLNATPTVTVVEDINITGISSVNYVDNGSTGYTIEPTELLYKGGVNIVPQTIAQKDNTLFLGNIVLKDDIASHELREMASNLKVSTIDKVYTQDTLIGKYPYTNTMSYDIDLTTFHSNDWYRVGIQLQRNTGIWSEVIYIKDYKVNRNVGVSPISINSEIKSHISGVALTVELSDEFIEAAVNAGYIKARVVAVYPSIYDREVIAQGILCPTIYNIEDRYTNSPFSQSSWFSRPFLGVDINKSSLQSGISNHLINNGELYDNENTPRSYDNKDIINYGVWSEFRHNTSLPNNYERNAEIQCNCDTLSTRFEGTIHKDANVSEFVSSHKDVFMVDQSIVTMHSPEFEFDDSVQNMDLSNAKLRIVGKVIFTANSSSLDIQTTSPSLSNTAIGEYKEPIDSTNISPFGSRGLSGGLFYMDGISVTNSSDNSSALKLQAGYFVYPWHRNGSLNNEGVPKDNITRSAMLKSKKLSNLKFAAYNEYFKTPWESYIENDDNHTGISGAQIFASDIQSLLKIPSPANSTIPDIIYYGNIDRVISPARIDKTITIPGGISKNLKNGYPIIAGKKTFSSEVNKDTHSTFSSELTALEEQEYLKPTATYGTEPISIKYKSTPHAVIAFNYTKSKKQVILPTTNWLLDDNIYELNNMSRDFSFSDDPKLFWDSNCTGVYQDRINNNINMYCNGFGYLFLAELYNDNISNRFGGSSQESIKNNLWIPVSDSISLVSGYTIDDETPIPKNTFTIIAPYGDTFIQRYDCLKTYPYTLEDQNSVVETVSFMCETRINIDGRYDRNRGEPSLVATPQNFNLINPVYTQSNNYFTYHTLDYSKDTNNYFPTTVTWSKEKLSNSNIDAWTNITMASTLDFDGNKGEIISLNTFNNEILCFQKQGISNILFNSRVQIPTSDGVPIEISNGLKVDGKRYISSTIGCDNKWSITEAHSGIYFIDSITNSIYLFNGQIISLSDKLGFRQWISKNSSSEKWDPIGFNNFISYYDNNNGDVYFVNKQEALVYSELLGQFTSFMSYGEVPAMFNIDKSFYSIKDGKLWEQFAGKDYSTFFGKYCPYSITFISNTDEPYDKIFNTVEFRADCWTTDDKGNDIIVNNATFDTLEVWNEYQKGKSDLTSLRAKPSPLKRKFRIWRANVPRANTDWNGVKANNRDRIRNTWAYIKLAMNKKNTNRMEFHDMVVHYFI